MQYNTQKDKLILSGYGRIVQDMVRHAMTIEDRKERNRCAHTIIRVMGALTDQNPRRADAQQKLWDHLAEIADYKLDVDYPVEITPQAERTSRPQPLPYPTKQIRGRHYGSNIEAALDRLAAMDDSPLRDRLTGMVANQMKRLLTDQTRDTRTDDRIHDDIERYTGGKVTLDRAFRFANPNAKSTQGSNALQGTKKRKKK